MSPFNSKGNDFLEMGQHANLKLFHAGASRALSEDPFSRSELIVLTGELFDIVCIISKD